MVPWSQDPAALAGHKAWWLKKPDADVWRETMIVQARLQGKALVAELEDVASREEAALLRGSEVAVPRTRLEPPAPDEYYWSDLEGMEVVNRSSLRLGRVVGLIESGAHPLLRVADESLGERLIPFVAAHIDRVDAMARRIEVDWEADY